MNFEDAPKRAFRKDFYENVTPYLKNIDSGVIGKSVLGEEIHYYKFGSGEKAILFVAAHHATEHISAAVLYEVISKISENLTRHRTSYGVNLQFLLQKFTFWFVPCLNPDGVDLHLGDAKDNILYDRQKKMNGGEDFSFWQANARGVDLNHNYDFGFHEYKRLESLPNISNEIKHLSDPTITA